MATPRMDTPRLLRFTAHDHEGLSALQDPANVYRFERHVSVTGDCWHWTGALDSKGYPLVKLRFAPGKRHMARASRVALALALGTVPDDAYSSPSCGNRACVNPAHLVPVLPVEITRRSIQAGRHVSVWESLKTACPASHPYRPGNLYREANGWRKCRTCRLAREARRYARRKENVA